MKKVIIVGGGGLDLTRLAMALVQLNSAEINKLKVILKEEYNIEPAEDVCLKKEFPLELEKTFELKDVAKIDFANIERMQKQKPFVPRKIGKPCKMPPQRRK